MVWRFLPSPHSPSLSLVCGHATGTDTHTSLSLSAAHSLSVLSLCSCARVASLCCLYWVLSGCVFLPSVETVACSCRHVHTRVYSCIRILSLSLSLACTHMLTHVCVDILPTHNPLTQEKRERGHTENRQTRVKENCATTHTVTGLCTLECR